MHLLFFALHFLWASPSEDKIKYSCQNCFLTELVPFGEKSIAVFLNPADANRSRLVLLDEKNLGVDTVSGFLQGFGNIVKTSDTTFVTFGSTSVWGRITNNQILLDSVLSVKDVKKLKISGYEFESYAFMNKTTAWIEFLKYKGKNPISQLFHVPLSALKNRQDNVMLSPNYYGGRISAENMFLLSGRSKENPIPEPFSEPFESGLVGSFVIYHPNEGFIYFKRTSQEFFNLNQKKALPRLKETSTAKQIFKVFVDFQTGKKYVIVRDEKSLEKELWEVPNFSFDNYTRVGSIEQIPYLIEGGKLYFIKDTSLGRTILMEKL